MPFNALRLGEGRRARLLAPGTERYQRASVTPAIHHGQDVLHREPKAEPFTQRPRFAAERAPIAVGLPHVGGGGGTECRSSVLRASLRQPLDIRNWRQAATGRTDGTNPVIVRVRRGFNQADVVTVSTGERGLLEAKF